MSAAEKTSITLPTPKKGFIVVLSNKGNPDHGQNPRSAVYGTTCSKQKAATIAEASRLALNYIRDNSLGMGNWVGTAGNIIDGDTKKVVAQLSYNGRAWLPGGYPQPEVAR